VLQKKYQIFISSTYEDLKEARAYVHRAILDANQIPVGMETFSASHEDQWLVIAPLIAEADYYVLILAHRYGTLLPDGISYTEREYRHAVENGIPALVFPIDAAARWNSRHIDKGGAASKLKSFKASVGKGRLWKKWKSPEELARHVMTALHEQFRTNPRRGWIRGPDEEVSNETETADYRTLAATLIEKIQNLLDLSQEAGRIAQEISSARMQILFNVGSADKRPEMRLRKAEIRTQARRLCQELRPVLVKATLGNRPPVFSQLIALAQAIHDHLASARSLDMELGKYADQCRVELASILRRIETTPHEACGPIMRNGPKR